MPNTSELIYYLLKNLEYQVVYLRGSYLTFLNFDIIIYKIVTVFISKVVENEASKCV